jgi:thymidylate kinase
MNSVIVLEALDGVGKSTVAKIVARKLNARLYRPSSSVNLAAEQAITLPYGSNERSEALRQTLTLMSKEIESLARTNTIIIDRFYASWASAEAGVGNFRIATLSMQDWPRDLIKPDLSIHLRVDEEERLRRIGIRDFQNQRELKLGNNHAYRFRVLRGLTRLTDIDVDNTFRTPEETASIIASMYRDKAHTEDSRMLIAA